MVSAILRVRRPERGVGLYLVCMESQRVVVVVEDAAAARSALQWAVGNFIRSSDSITLLHVCPPARSRRKRRRLRLGGFQLALAFKDLCNGIAEVRTDVR